MWSIVAIRVGEVVRRLRREGDRQAAHGADAALLVALAGQVADGVEGALGGPGVDGQRRRRPWPRWPWRRASWSAISLVALLGLAQRRLRGGRGPAARPGSAPGCGAARRTRRRGPGRCPRAGLAAWPMSRSSFALSPPVSATLTGARASEPAVTAATPRADQPHGRRCGGPGRFGRYEAHWEHGYQRPLLSQGATRRSGCGPGRHTRT